ncbi:MAG: hypothetical protein J6M07_05945 [Ruminococcus sp.]|nr:hypothetical protein [Ruminococcus sp.]MBP3267843.1 hypothetical protein [Ruminococcus sp.]
MNLQRNTTDMLSKEEFELLEVFSKLDENNKIKLKERAETLLEMQKGEPE